MSRHRGKSPRRAAFFFRDPEVTFHAKQLTSLFLIHGLRGAARDGLESHYRVGSLESRLLLSRTYEADLEFHTPVSISFEHAGFWLLALARRDEVAVSVATGAVVCDCAIYWPSTAMHARVAIRRPRGGRTEAIHQQTDGFLDRSGSSGQLPRPRSAVSHSRQSRVIQCGVLG